MEDRADFGGSYSVDKDILRKLEERLGPLHARQRLGIDADHEAQVFGQGLSFARITNRASYTHFVEADGTIIALRSMQNLRETKVGVVFAQEFPTDEQRAAIAHLANLA